MFKSLFYTVLLLGNFCPAAPAKALTLKQVTEAQAMIANITELKSELDALDTLPGVLSVVIVPKYGYFDESGSCCHDCATNGCADKQGPGDRAIEALRYKRFTISRKVMYEQVQAQIDECMKKLNALGVTP